MSSNTVALIEMLRLLNRAPITRIKLAEACGLNRGTVQRYVKRLHAKRLVRVADWYRSRCFGEWIPLFEWNQDGLPDADKPVPLSVAERSRRYKQKKCLTGWIKPSDSP